MARFCFLDPASREFHPDWRDVATSTVAVLRSTAGRDPFDRELTDLVGELATRSEDFRTRWASHSTEPGSPSQDALALLASRSVSQTPKNLETERPGR